MVSDTHLHCSALRKCDPVCLMSVHAALQECYCNMYLLSSLQK